MLMSANSVTVMKNKWYVARYDIGGEPAYIAEKRINSFKNVLRRNIMNTGPFTRDREAVKRVVEALNRRETGK